MAGRAPIEWTRQHGPPIRNAGYAEAFTRGLDEQLVRFRRRGSKKHTIGRAPYAFTASCHPDERFRLVVIRADVVITDRPVRPQTVTISGLEIVIGEPEGQSTVVIGAPPDNSRTKPFELASLAYGVGLTIKLPPATCRREVPEWFPTTKITATSLLRPTVGNIVRPLMLLEFLVGIEHRTGLEQGDP